MEHKITIRVYYEDTDAGGIVYHSNFINFAERGRTELLRFLGFENKSLRESQGILFVVRHIEAEYLKPAYLDDLLELQTTVIQIKNTSLLMKQSIYRNNDLIFTADVTVVSIDAGSLKPTRIPDGLRGGFEQYYRPKE